MCVGVRESNFTNRRLLSNHIQLLPTCLNVCTAEQPVGIRPLTRRTNGVTPSLYQTSTDSSPTSMSSDQPSYIPSKSSGLPALRKVSVAVHEVISFGSENWASRPPEVAIR